MPTIAALDASSGQAVSEMTEVTEVTMRNPLRPGAWARTVASVVATLLLGVLVGESSAQNQNFAPYYGKNRIRYDNFRWHIYDTDHFEIFYYPEIEQHLERVAGYAESAYQHVSSELKHDLAFKVPLIIYKTHSEFQQQNVIPGDVPEGVAAFAEPMRDRMVLPIDEPPDQLYRLITHELTHIFEFDIIPRSLVRRGIPLWVDEGLADYLAGVWRPLDLMTVRDAAVADIIPKMSELEGYGQFNNPRLIYNLGHTVFEFIESRWGKEGIRQFLFSLRRSVIGGGDSAYDDALDLSADDFDQEYDKYIKDRFKPFRDKERPADYGKNLAPNRERTNFTTVLSIEPSPSGDLLAAMAGNRKEGELDIILISAQDGQVVRNLTEGFDQDKGFEYISLPGARFNTVPWMSWSPIGDRLAFFVRRSKGKSLILENILTSKVEQRIEMQGVDAPESPDIGPQGRRVAFSALKEGIGDIYIVDLETEEITNLTNDELADYAPTFTPDGTAIVYMSRVSGSDKLFQIDLASGQKTQLTFGTHDAAAAQFLDDHTIVFASTATDPTQPIDPDVARNGNIYNTWTLDLNNGELRQYTDALGANVSTVVLAESDASRIAFVTYFKGDYGVHTLSREEPLSIAASSDFGAPGPVIDFQAPLTHTLVKANQRRKGTFEKLFLEGRPPVNLGVTSGGDLFGGTAITFTDVLGDKQFSMYAASVSQYRTLAFSYLNLSRRLQYAAQGFSQTEFFFGLQPGVFFNQGAFLSRDQAIATRTTRGGSVFGIYPFDRFRRLELSAGIVQYAERFDDPVLEVQSRQFQEQQFGTQVFRNGMVIPIGVTFIQETTVFREYGPLAGNTFRLAYEFAPSVGDSLSRQTIDVDARVYRRIGTNGVLALRGRGFRSWGDFPDFTFFGGNSEMRGYRYLEFVGHKAFFADAELRFPLIEAMLTPIGVLGGVRAVLFANVGGAGFNEQPFKIASTSNQLVRPVLGFATDPTTGASTPVLGAPTQISGFRLEDARASYGLGLETFALGFPIHFDWSWRTLFNKAWEDALFATSGGSAEFRKSRFDIWIGYDF